MNRKLIGFVASSQADLIVSTIPSFTCFSQLKMKKERILIESSKLRFTMLSFIMKLFIKKRLLRN